MSPGPSSLRAGTPDLAMTTPPFRSREVLRRVDGRHRDLVVVVQTEIDPLGDGSEGLDTSKLTFMVGDVIAPAAR